MGTSRGAAYRRFYLYSALSVAVIAIAVALALLLHLGLQIAGFGARPLSNEPSRNVSLAVALLAIALPVAAVHLWLILRSFADPAERAAGIRHQYLNLWVAFGLFVVLFATQTAISDWSRDPTADATGPASIAIVAALVAAIAALWIAATPPATPRSRVRASVVVMLISVAVAAFSAGNAAAAAGGLFGSPYVSRQSFPSRFDPRTFQEQSLRSGYLVAAIALVIWSFAFAWQRPFREARDRLGYALAGYGVGTALLLGGVAFGIGGAVQFIREPACVDVFTGSWGPLAAGALLVAVHGTLLLADRGRNGHPPVTTTRLLLAFPAIVGLAMVVGGLGLGWHAILERDEVDPQHLADDLTQAAALLLVGLAAFVPSWLAFDRRTTAGSAVRRFYLFSVVCLALVAGLVTAVTVLYEAITAVIGVGDAFAWRTAATWAVPALAFALIFATHLRLLLRDQRQTRAADAAVATDPLLALLEEVRAGRVSAEAAAAAIRGGVG